MRPRCSRRWASSPAATPTGEPVYNEFYLCADPRERLFTLGRWQEDLLPSIGVTADDRRAVRRLLRRNGWIRTARGSGRPQGLRHPARASSADAGFRALDRIGMADWMQAQGWDSEHAALVCRLLLPRRLRHPAADVSAWAGIHYFAARDGKGADDEHASVLTWPEGNGWIVGQLRQRLQRHLQCSALAWRDAAPREGGVAVDVFDPAAQRSRRIEARAVILAVPALRRRPLAGTGRPTPRAATRPGWSPTSPCGACPAGRGMPLCWDNVFRQSRSLGYVVATHQALERVRSRTVLTHYWPLSDQPPEDARRRERLATAAGGLAGAGARTTCCACIRSWTGAVASIDVCLWGHGMIRPTPGLPLGGGPGRRLPCRPRRSSPPIPT